MNVQTLADPATTFQLGSLVASLSWLALALSPARARWSAAVRRATGLVVPALLSVAYFVLLAVHWSGEGGFGSLAEVQALFAVPGLLAAGWLHYLAFDLFVGSWIAGRAAALGWPHALLLPLLVLTFMFGPAGLLAYAALRTTVLRAPRAPRASQTAGAA